MGSSRVASGDGEGGFDRAAAVTRSLLGWGVVAGGFYILLGLGQALTRDGFDLTRHPLSLLMLGEYGWMQTANLALSGIMVIAAAVGFVRAMRGATAARRAGTLLGLFGVSMVASGIFPPDPMAGFPAGTASEQATTSGLLHLAFGAVGFVCLAAATFAVASWMDQRQARTWARYSRASGTVVAVGFVAGAALSTQRLGVAFLWAAVVAGLGWLTAASVFTYRTVPHPDSDRREPSAV